MFPLEVAAVILLVASVAALALTQRQRRDSKAIDPAVQVRVTDEGGAPVPGVEVELRSARRHGKRVRAMTSPAGTAELFAREHRTELVRDGARVGLAAFLREPVEAPVDLERPPSKPIELCLPPAGADGNPPRRWTMAADTPPSVSSRTPGKAAESMLIL